MTAVARQIYSFSVAVPAGTPASAPQVSPLTIPSLAVDRVEVRVPPGPNGAVGWALAVSGQPIIPYNGGEWIVTDNEVIGWDLEDYPESGDWQLTAYNIGGYSHSLYVRLLCSLVAPPTSQLPQPLATSQLAGSLVPGQ